jgi:hypothetical protein
MFSYVLSVIVLLTIVNGSYTSKLLRKNEFGTVYQLREENDGNYRYVEIECR